MHSRTPFRQISRLYASIVALGRAPDEAKVYSQEMTHAIKAMTQEISSALAQSTIHNVAAIRQLTDQIRASAQPPTAPTVPVQPTSAPAAVEPEVTAPMPVSPVLVLLNQFRRGLLRRLDAPLLCVDVGARWGADSALLALKEKAKLLCFDPDEEECARLQAGQPLDQVEYVPLALSSDGRELSLTIARQPACSSIFSPVEALYEKYPACEEMTPEKVVTMSSSSLDSFLAERGLSSPDLYKLDTQGSELDILKGAIGNLANACMIDIEVEFSPLYHGAALFGNVDVLRAQGFALWRLPQMVHYAQENFPVSETPLEAVAAPPWRTLRTNPGNGQLFWGQAHYVRVECLATNPQQVSADLARRCAAIASAYGYWDLSLMVLEKCAETTAEAATLREIMTSK